ncbi:MAG: LuxR C-terminal-related transcriptional regulator [Solirubrobacteraceae bacterium]
MSASLPPLRLLHDDAGLWDRATEVLEPTRPTRSETEEGMVVGVVTWTSATRGEVAQLDSLREQHDGPLVAILAEMPSARGARAVSALVEGAVLADDLERSLTVTLAAVAAGQCVVPRAIRQVLERPPLSPRERQVLAMVVMDFSNAEIAQKLVVTESNVKSHLTSAFSKLGVTSRNAAAELILDHESGLGPGILRISSEQ